jgi:hypothetical protein
MLDSTVEHGEKLITEAELRKRFDFWIRHLRLEHWNFELRPHEEPDGDEQEAEIIIPADYDYGQIRFNKTWRKWSHSLIDEVLVHELIHAHLHKLQVAAMDGSRGFNDEAAAMYMRRLGHEVEHAVDALTIATLRNVLGLKDA